MNGYTVAAVYGTITGAANVGCLLNKPIEDGKKGSTLRALTCLCRVLRR